MTNESPEFLQMLEILQKHSPSSSSIPIAHTFDWEHFYTLMVRHRVWYQASKWLHLHAIQPTPDVQKKIEQLCKKDKQQLLITAMETIRIARILTTHQITHCFVKGVLLNVHLYESLNDRPCRDIDLWVDIARFDDAAQILRDLGYQQKLPIYDLQGFKKTYHFTYRHDVAFYHPKRQCLVELHFKLDPFNTPFFPMNQVLFQPISLMNTPILCLEDNYHLLYLMIHGAVHIWNRLRWLRDIALFIQKGKCDLNQVFKLAKEIDCQCIVEQALILAHTFFDVKEVIAFIQHPSPRALSLVKMAKPFIVDDYEMIDGLGNINMFFKRRLYLLTLAHSNQKMKTLLSDFLKIDNLFPYVTFPESFSFMYYVVYPFWVIGFIRHSSKPRTRKSFSIKSTKLSS